MGKELNKIILFNEKVQDIFELGFYQYLRENKATSLNWYEQ